MGKPRTIEPEAKYWGKVCLVYNFFWFSIEFRQILCVRIASWLFRCIHLIMILRVDTVQVFRFRVKSNQNWIYRFYYHVYDRIDPNRWVKLSDLVFANSVQIGVVLFDLGDFFLGLIFCNFIFKSLTFNLSN